jgi:hypothetical protein
VKGFTFCDGFGDAWVEFPVSSLMPILVVCTKVYQNASVNVAIKAKGSRDVYGRDLQITNVEQESSAHESGSAGAAMILFSSEQGSSRNQHEWGYCFYDGNVVH